MARVDWQLYCLRQGSTPNTPQSIDVAKVIEAEIESPIWCSVLVLKQLRGLKPSTAGLQAKRVGGRVK